MAAWGSTEFRADHANERIDQPPPRHDVGALVIAVALALGLSLRSSLGPERGARITQAFYSDDDGKSYFAEALAKPSPFDHGGKLAYRAYVYRCSDSSITFVGYLARQAPDEKPQGAMGSTADAVKAGAAQGKSAGLTEVKKPGDSKWVAINGADGTTIINVTCSDGERPLAVVPGS